MFKYKKLLQGSVSAQDFAEKSGLPYWKAYEIVKKHAPQITSRVYINTNKIKDLIIQGKTVDEIASVVSVSKQHIRNHFHKMGLPLNGKGSGGQNAKVKHNPFTDSKESQYWIGFILADGHISKHKYSVVLCQKESDADILNQFDKFIGVKLHKVRKLYKVQSGEERVM